MTGQRFWPRARSCAEEIVAHLRGAIGDGAAATTFDPAQGEEIECRSRADASTDVSLGLRLREQGDTAGATKAFRRADKRGDAEGANYLGILLWERDDQAGAERALRRADERGSAAGADNLGLLLNRRGDATGAEAAWRRAIERGDPDAAKRLAALARLRELCGNSVSERRPWLEDEIVRWATFEQIAFVSSCFDDWDCAIELAVVTSRRLLWERDQRGGACPGITSGTVWFRDVTRATAREMAGSVILELQIGIRSHSLEIDDPEGKILAYIQQQSASTPVDSPGTNIRGLLADVSSRESARAQENRR